MNTELQTCSYLGGSFCATIHDYECCANIRRQEIHPDHPHLLRWHSHISRLVARHGNFDHFGNPLSVGPMMNTLDCASAQAGDKGTKQLQNRAPPKKRPQHHHQRNQDVSLEAKIKDLTISARPDPITILDGTCPMTFTAVLPFYSHTARSKEFVRIDDAVGIDRRVFSNLYAEPDGSLYRVPCAPESMGGQQLMRHAFLSEVEGSSSEAFFQAAKCELEADARFTMELSPLDAAKYVRGRLDPNVTQLRRLAELGLETEEGLACPNAAYRDQDAAPGVRRRIPPRRADWEEVKMDVMMHVCRHKFSVSCSLDAPTAASSSMAALAVSSHTWLLVEHPRLGGDRTWGDGGDGNGSNMLGKCLSALVLEARGSPAVGRLSSFDRVRALNNTIVDYTR